MLIRTLPQFIVMLVFAILLGGQLAHAERVPVSLYIEGETIRSEMVIDIDPLRNSRTAALQSIDVGDFAQSALKSLVTASADADPLEGASSSTATAASLVQSIYAKADSAQIVKELEIGDVTVYKVILTRTGIPHDSRGIPLVVDIRSGTPEVSMVLLSHPLVQVISGCFRYGDDQPPDVGAEIEEIFFGTPFSTAAEGQTHLRFRGVSAAGLASPSESDLQADPRREVMKAAAEFWRNQRELLHRIPESEGFADSAEFERYTSCFSVKSKAKVQSLFQSASTVKALHIYKHRYPLADSPDYVLDAGPVVLCFYGGADNRKSGYLKYDMLQKTDSGFVFVNVGVTTGLDALLQWDPVKEELLTLIYGHS